MVMMDDCNECWDISVEEKVRVYEKVLHQLEMFEAVTMDYTKLSGLVNLIHSWSYAHRQGNGELSEIEVEQNIFKQFNKMKEY